MPAIDPLRLEREIDKLVEAIDDPAALRRHSLDLLGFYADRTRRSASAKGARGTTKSLGVPRPVLRILGHALHQQAPEQPQSALAAADSLWEAGYRETQFMAAALLGGLDDDEVPAWAEEHIGGCRDYAALQELAERGLAGWRTGSREAFLARASAWLETNNARLRGLALLALAVEVANPEFEDLPSVFGLARGQADSVRGETRQALFALVRALARRSPPETARFLLDDLADERSGARRLVREVLKDFPPRHRAALRKALSG
ncbi:MAG: DNA alkylation repair protein [Anaerolineales bacterium]|jgi:hypothetical protein